MYVYHNVHNLTGSAKTTTPSDPNQAVEEKHAEIERVVFQTEEMLLLNRVAVRSAPAEHFVPNRNVWVVMVNMEAFWFDLVKAIRAPSCNGRS